MRRRNLLQIAGLGASSLAAGCRGGGELGLRAPRPSGFDSGTAAIDTGDTGSIGDTGAPADTETPIDTGSPADPTLADTGPELDARMPRSVMSTAGRELDVDLTVLSGTLPDDLSGHGFIVHPIPQGGGSPLFVGEGVLMRLDFRPDGVGLKSRMLRSPCHYADEATQGTSYGFSNVSFSRISWSLGMRAFRTRACSPSATACW